MSTEDRKVQSAVSRWFAVMPDRFIDKYPKSIEGDEYDWAWDVFEYIENGVKRSLCFIYGHKPEQDHCGVPAHDCCFFCGVLMPGKAPRTPRA